jgi:cytochrome b561
MQNFAPIPEKRFVYGSFFRLLHWSVALCFIIVVALIFSRTFVEDPGIDKQIVNFHRSFGLLAFLLVLIRLSWRLFSRHMPYTGNNPMIQLVASISHANIYLLLLATPFLGWMEASARHKPVSIFGYDMPLILEKNIELANELQVWHRYLAYYFCTIIVIHVSSALWHHFFRKDGVLYAMLPLRVLRKPWLDRLQAANETFVAQVEPKTADIHFLNQKETQ